MTLRVWIDGALREVHRLRRADQVERTTLARFLRGLIGVQSWSAIPSGLRAQRFERTASTHTQCQYLPFAGAALIRDSPRSRDCARMQSIVWLRVIFPQRRI